MEFLIGTLLVPVVLYIFSYERSVNNSKPEIIVETIFNHALSIRNVGEKDAKYIVETTDWFRDVPKTLRANKGNIDYYKNRDPGIYKQVDFKDLNNFNPNKPARARFEYKDPEGHKFYSEIEIKRRPDNSPPWFFEPNSISGRVWL